VLELLLDFGLERLQLLHNSLILTVRVSVSINFRASVKVTVSGLSMLVLGLKRERETIIGTLFWKPRFMTGVRFSLSLSLSLNKIFVRVFA
jgi:hypothetical protein